MRVTIGKKVYRMSRKEYQGMLAMAKEQVPLGVYAVEKNKAAELRCDHCKSISQVKNLVRQYRAAGF